MRAAARRARRRQARRPRSRGIPRRGIGALLSLMLCMGLYDTCKPLLDDLHSSVEAEQVISGLSDSVDNTDDADRLSALAQAQAYNLRLGGDGSTVDNAGMGGCNEGPRDIADVSPQTPETETKPYAQQLENTFHGAMCWIEIPAIALREPVYHGTSDAALSMGVGHIDWSSLPVGGSSSHCVLAAHSAMDRCRMFDQLDQLETGDTFVIHVLGDAYAYQVTSQEVVTPAEASQRCQIVQGQDLCTLVTCTPYGINSHRLLVHGERVPFVAAPEASAERLTSVATSRHARPLLRLLVLIALCSIGLVFARTLNGARKHLRGCLLRR